MRGRILPLGSQLLDRTLIVAVHFLAAAGGVVVFHASDFMKTAGETDA